MPSFLGVDFLDFWAWIYQMSWVTGSGSPVLDFSVSCVSECGFLGYLGLDFQNVLDFCFSAFLVFVLGSGLGFVGLGF